MLGEENEGRQTQGQEGPLVHPPQQPPPHSTPSQPSSLLASPEPDPLPNFPPHWQCQPGPGVPFCLLLAPPARTPARPSSAPQAPSILTHLPPNPGRQPGSQFLAISPIGLTHPSPGTQPGPSDPRPRPPPPVNPDPPPNPSLQFPVVSPGALTHPSPGTPARAT